MPSFDKAPQHIIDLANDILCRYPSHKPLLDAKVKIDIIMVSPEYGEDGQPVNDALKKNGVRAFGITRKLPPKDRAMGRGDAEVCLDADWWQHAEEKQRVALLDHELHHISVKVNKAAAPVKEDDGRPKIVLRKHDYEFGWFNVIAERHGIFSLEVEQAKAIADNHGQFYWPQMYVAELEKK